MEKEQQYVVNAFQQNIGIWGGKQVILYGVGKNTEAILEHTEGFRFLGLMDQGTVGQEIYGCRVLSEEEALEGYQDDRVIVIIARESVVGIIYKRIEHLREEYGIPIYDYSGKDLSMQDTAFEPKPLPYWNASYAGLCAAIDAHDVISFDIFDTLLMRRVLLPTDVFLVVEEKLKQKGTDISFASIRQSAEKSIADACPSLDDIYGEMGKHIKDSDLLEELKRLEIQTDEEQLVSREVVVDAFRHAIHAGKRVYLLSDMYYSSGYLQELLDKYGITGYENIFVSNELKCMKEEGSAYRKYKDLATVNQNDTFLHIGDNRRADIEMGERYGLDTYQVYSGYELLMASSLQGLLVDVASLHKRCLLGLLVAEVFRDPFALCEMGGLLRIGSLRMLGYAFAGSMMGEFTRWLMQVIRKRRATQLLLPSRDGYFIQKLYQLMEDSPVDNVYFRTSRRAATVAGIRSRDDMERIALRGFQGTVCELMKKRFGIDISGDDRAELAVTGENQELVVNLVAEYEAMIYNRAEEERNHYLKYLKEKGVKADGEGILVFDFVTSGTIPYYLSQILDNKLKCVCFSTMNLPNQFYREDTEDILSAYGNIQSYGSRSALSKHYLLLETILTDDRETLAYIDSNGNEVFEGDGRNHKFSEISQIWDGIFDFVHNYKKLYGDIMDGLDLELADQIYGELFSEYLVVDEDIKQVFSNDDLYDGVEKYPVWE